MGPRLLDINRFQAKRVIGDRAKRCREVLPTVKEFNSVLALLAKSLKLEPATADMCAARLQYNLLTLQAFHLRWGRDVTALPWMVSTKLSQEQRTEMCQAASTERIENAFPRELRNMVKGLTTELGEDLLTAVKTAVTRIRESQFDSGTVDPEGSPSADESEPPTIGDVLNTLGFMAQPEPPKPTVPPLFSWSKELERVQAAEAQVKVEDEAARSAEDAKEPTDSASPAPVERPLPRTKPKPSQQPLLTFHNNTSEAFKPASEKIALDLSPIENALGLLKKMSPEDKAAALRVNKADLEKEVKKLIEYSQRVTGDASRKTTSKLLESVVAVASETDLSSSETGMGVKGVFNCPMCKTLIPERSTFASLDSFSDHLLTCHLMPAVSIDESMALEVRCPYKSSLFLLFADAFVKTNLPQMNVLAA